MAWNNENNIVKYEGKCWNRGKHKYCSFWKAKHTKALHGGKGVVIGFRCTLFDQDKRGYDSLPDCNNKYGQTYDGRKKP
jgi:hypothetical protein